MEPIGVLASSCDARYETPHQPNASGKEATITLNKGCDFEQALEGLDGFSHVWVLFSFHKAAHWKPKVRPPGMQKKVGVFATRSPHRPNHIGMSLLPLKVVARRHIVVGGCDILNGTPILDIKPYIPGCDRASNVRQGWIEERASAPLKTVQYAPSYVAETHMPSIACLTTILNRRSRRITKRWDGGFELAYKTLRIQVCEQATVYQIDAILDANSFEKGLV